MKIEKRKYFHRYLPIPRQLIQAELPSIGNAELRVYLYILERTIGYGKTSDTIYLDQFCRGVRSHAGVVIDVGTGLKRSTVKKALKWLEDCEWISVTRQHRKPSQYTISKFLRVTPVAPNSAVKGHSSDPNTVIPVTPSINNQESEGAGEKVVPFRKRRVL